MELGLIVFFIIAVIVFWGIGVVLKYGDDSNRDRFDEMQEKKRADAYKAAMTTEELLFMLYALSYDWFDKSKFNDIFSPSFVIVFILMIGLSVFSGMCIWNDTCVGVKDHEKRNKKFLRNVLLLAAIWGINFGIKIRTGTLLYDGKISFFSACPILMSAYYAIQLIISILKKISISKNEGIE